MIEILCIVGWICLAIIVFEGILGSFGTLREAANGEISLVSMFLTITAFWVGIGVLGSIFITEII